MSNYIGKKPSLFTRIRNSPTVQRGLRFLQFLSSLISLILFSMRISRVIAIAKKANRAQGAVEGILAAAVLYTLLVTFYKVIKKHTGSKLLRWVLIALDLAFVGAFIAVAILTRSNGPAGPCPRNTYTPIVPKGYHCNLPWGTFILAIVSTILHALTAIFHQVKDHYHDNKAIDHERAEMAYQNRGHNTQ